MDTAGGNPAKRKSQKVVERLSTHAYFAVSYCINLHSLHILSRHSSSCETFVNLHETSTYV